MAFFCEMCQLKEGGADSPFQPPSDSQDKRSLIVVLVDEHAGIAESTLLNRRIGSQTQQHPGLASCSSPS